MTYLKMVELMTQTEANDRFILCLVFRRRLDGVALAGALRAGEVVWC